MDINAILQQVAVSAIPIVIAITFHEAAHGYAAYRLGDPTAKMLGRLTLNPLKHIDPVGTIVMPIMLLVLTQGRFVFGYAKPVPIGVHNFKDPRRHMAITGAAGPLTNIVLALLSVWLIRLLGLAGGILPDTIERPVYEMLKSSAYINVFLASLNLLPVPPLDGGRVLAGLLPRDLANRLDRVEPYGMIIVIILLVTNLANFFIMPVVQFIIRIINMLS